MTDIAKLKALAEKATPGPWFDDGSGAVRFDGRYLTCCGRGARGCCGDPEIAGDIVDIAVVKNEHDAAYIAAANPPAVLELIAEIERLRWSLEPFAEIAVDYGGEYDDYDSGLVEVRHLRNARAALEQVK